MLLKKQIKLSKVTSVKEAELKHANYIKVKNYEIGTWRLLGTFFKYLLEPQGIILKSVWTFF